MDVRSAIQLAINSVLRLEEVIFDEFENDWKITLSFEIESGSCREYKTVVVNDIDGKVRFIEK
jgi:hypothetical protein